MAEVMKDIRMPIDVYNAIIAEKTAWNCSILEAADRVELERRSGLESTSLTKPVTTERLALGLDMPPENGSQTGVQ